MSIWSEIKHALNSTLGTKEFKPLDEIVLGNWNLAPSEKSYISESAQYAYNSATYTFSYNNKFKFLTNGSVTFYLLNIASASSFEKTYTVNIYEDGRLIETIERTVEIQSTASAASKTLTIKKGSVYSFELVHRRGHSITPNTISVRCEPRYAPLLVESLTI